MKLNTPTETCDPDRLESFLNGDLSDVQEREITLHLNTCESCRRALEQQAAAPEAWREAETLLKRSGLHSHNADEPSSSTFVKLFHGQPRQIQTVLDALGATDDPEMLGRLGGYEVSGVVGAGGMGVVLKAVDQSLDRTVAIKVLAPHLATSGAARKRFAREAKAAAAVLHPNVIAIHSVSNDEALPYLVMPYIRGTSLQKRLDQEGPLPLKEILRIGSQIAAGLAAAHAQGLVHRDIKPANILLEEGVERVTITDFGLARAVDDATMTQSGAIAGTPQYMSPEQVRGEGVEQRSDQFSLGSVLYAICTGRPPFRAETTYGVMRRITDQPPTSIREINPNVPDWLCAIIARLMSKRAADRFQSAAEAAELLEKCLAHVQQPAAVPLPGSLVPVSTSRRWISRAGWKGVIAVLALFGFGLLTLIWQPAAKAPQNTAEALKRSPVPKGAHIGRGAGSVMVVHDDVDVHYVCYHAGEFGTSSASSHNTHSLAWMDEGGITLKDGTTFGYHRESVDPFHLRVNGKEYDLRQGRVLELNEGGSVKQVKHFPSLPTAKTPEALATLIASAREMNAEPVTAEKIRLQLEVAESQLQDLLKTHAPSHPLVVEVSQSVQALRNRIQEWNGNPGESTPVSVFHQTGNCWRAPDVGRATSMGPA